MALKQDQTSKEYSINVTNDNERRKMQRGQKSTAQQEINTRKFKKRTLANTEITDIQIEKRKKGEEFENEETLLRDRLLDEIDSLEPSRNYDSLSSTKGSSSGDVEENSNGETTFFQDRKIIKLKGKLPNLALPDGWLALNHRSGGIIYLHRPTRVCTWSRPYYLGKGSVRKHDVPIAAIPCLHQRKALETEPNLNSLQNDPSEQPAQTQGLGSVLNFINTAGTSRPSDDGPIQQQQTDINRIGFSGSKTGDDVSVSGDGDDGVGVSVSVIEDNCGVSADVRKGDNEVGGPGDRCFIAISDNIMNVTKSKCPVFEENDGFGHTHVGCGIRNKVDGITEPGCSALQYNHKECDSAVGDESGGSGNINSGVDADISDDTAANRSGNSDKGENIYSQNIPNMFHPKDGLDIVNDTLSVQKNYFSKSSESGKSISSSELESSTDLENVLKETTFGITNNSTRNSFNLTDDKVNASEEEERTKEISESLKPSKCKMSTSISSKNTKQNLEQTCVSTEIKSGVELIDSEELSSYLEKLFEFEEVTRDQEQNVAMTTVDQSSEREESSLPPLLECLPYCVKGVNARQNKEWVLNPGGKTPIAILHEYSQAVLKEKPVYVCSECDNPSAPFMAEVQIDGITHGTGQALSKKQAKQAAAEATLQVFLPEDFKKIQDYQISPQELEYFDNLKIDHPNVYEVSIKSGLPSPSQLLQECLKRNQGVCSSIINFKIIPGENQNHTYKISCGKHTAEGLCKNKKTGKQLASQALLKKLHPHVSTWGSLLRIYCDRPSSVVKKYKTPNDDVLMCNQQSSSGDIPRGEFLLMRLKEEMKKIANDEKQDRKSRPHSKDQKKNNPISTVDI